MTGRGVGRGPWSSGDGAGRSPSAVLIVSRVAVVLPLLILVYTSTQPYYSPPTAETLSNMSLDTYASVLSNDDTVRSLRNTLVLAAGYRNVVVLLGSHRRVARRPHVSAGALDWSTGSRSCRSRFRASCSASRCSSSTCGCRIAIYGTLWIMLIAFVTAECRRHAFSRRVHASDRRRARGVGACERSELVADLPPRARAAAAPGSVRGWIYVFVSSARQLSSAHAPLLSRQRSAVDQDLGPVPAGRVPGARRTRRDDDGRARRSDRGGVQASAGVGIRQL